MDIFVYLCDRHDCDKPCCPECSHTTTLEHSINFDHIPTEEEKNKHFELLFTDEEGNNHFWEKEGD